MIRVLTHLGRRSGTQKICPGLAGLLQYQTREKQFMQCSAALFTYPSSAAVCLSFSPVFPLGFFSGGVLGPPKLLVFLWGVRVTDMDSYQAWEIWCRLDNVHSSYNNFLFHGKTSKFAPSPWQRHSMKTHKLHNIASSRSWGFAAQIWGESVQPARQRL